MKLQTYDLSLFIGQSYFINNGSEKFLIIGTVFNTFTTPFGLRDIIVECKSKVFSNKNDKPLISPNHCISPKPIFWTIKK